MQTTTPSTSDLEHKINASLSPSFAALAMNLFNELQRYRAATAGRASGAAHRNSSQGQLLREKIAKAAALVPLHNLPPHERVNAVQTVLLRFGCQHFGLATMPTEKTLRRVVAEITGQ